MLGGALSYTRDVGWSPSWRIIPAGVPRFNRLEAVRNQEEYDSLIELVNFTDPTRRSERGDIFSIPPEERVFGEGSSFLMYPFTLCDSVHSHTRFSDGSFGVYYCACLRETAIGETVFHKEKFLQEHSVPPTRLESSIVLADLRANLGDVELMEQPIQEKALDPDSYIFPQGLGGTLRGMGIPGIVYPSVRHHGGFCAALFKPSVLRYREILENALSYIWDGYSIQVVAD